MPNINTSGIRGMLVKGIFATGGGVLMDFIVDFFRLPFLSESGMFGQAPAGQNNYETVVYALTVGGSTAAIIDYFSNSKPLGFSKEFLPYFMGFGFGTHLYESIIVNMIPGLKNFNLYQSVYDVVPSVPLL